MAACLITFPVVVFISTISGVVVDTATVFEELSVLEKVVTDTDGLQGVISSLLATQRACYVPIVPSIDPSLAPCT